MNISDVENQPRQNTRVALSEKFENYFLVLHMRSKERM